MDVTTILIAILFPALVAGVAFCPVIAVIRFVVLRRHGEGAVYERFKRTCAIVCEIAAALSYALFVIGLFFREVLPGWTAFLERGTIAVFVVPGFILIIVFANIFTKARALRQRPPLDR